MIVVIDLETTGLLRSSNPFGPGITQIGAVRIDENWDTTAEFTIDVNPEMHIDAWEQGAIKLRGIGPEDLVEAPTFFAAFWQFAEFVRGARVWCGHNINAFDTKVLANNLKRYGFEHHFPWPAHHVDTMEMVVKAYGKRKKLGDVFMDITGNKIANAHEALSDIHATIALAHYYGKDQIDQLVRRTA